MSFSLGRIAEVFDRTRGFLQDIMSKILKTSKEEPEGYRRLLDVGVGTGRFSKSLQYAGFEGVGADISKKMFEKTCERGV